MYRMERVNSEIMKNLLEIIKNMNDKRISGQIITISYVDTTPDLKLARVGVQTKDCKEVCALLNKCKSYIRKELASKMNMKSTPDVVFYEDKTEEVANRIEQLLKQIKN
ncbi:MAG: 30S ribosome-binding factor RbfA [Clostridia bacterium]|nr:30S ribosome-binding factor RbfA [Clostridia bacterium]